jgi:hypothetical protein
VPLRAYGQRNFMKITLTLGKGAHGIMTCCPGVFDPAESEARFRKYVKAGTVLCAPSIQPFERGRPVCGGRGPYGNSMMGRSGVKVCHGRAPGAPPDGWRTEAGYGKKVG